MEGGEGASICCGHNGVVWLEVAVHGRAAHGSMPETGVNALEKMSALVLALGDYKKKLARRKFATPNGLVMRPTLNVGGVFSCGEGAKVNTVPAHASFTIDRRVLAVENHAAAESDLRSFLAAAARKIPQCRITVTKISENFACFHPPTGPFFAAMASCVQQARRAPTVFNVSHRIQRHAFFCRGAQDPDPGLWPAGGGLSRRGRAGQRARTARRRQDLRGPDDDIRGLRFSPLFRPGRNGKVLVRPP